MPEHVRNIIYVILGILLWALCYYSSFWVFPNWKLTREMWKTFDPVKKYQLASCVHSTVHGVVVPIGILSCVSTCEIWNDFEALNCSDIEVIFALTVAYFLFDFALVMYYRAELWQVFAVHHVVGIMPFFIF